MEVSGNTTCRIDVRVALPSMPGEIVGRALNIGA